MKKIQALSTLKYISATAMACLALLLCQTALAQTNFSFTLTSGKLTTARYQHTATLLPDGLLLVAGGQDINTNPLSSAELYNPATGAWAGTGSLSNARVYHTATLLTNGLVLVAGGAAGDSGGDNGFTSAELYNPATGTWTATGSLITGRYQHTATLLPNGKVLIAGGLFNFTSNLTSAEIYDPSIGTFSATGSMTAAHYTHTATLLANGEVLVAGGYGPGGDVAVAELYNPSNGAWTATGSLTTARNVHTATLLPNGNVLVAGGFSTGPTALSSVEIYNQTNGVWTTTNSMGNARAQQTSTLLPDGMVLVTGGIGTGLQSLTNAEIYNPTLGTWSAAGGLATSLSQHTTTLLPSGEVLLAGGSDGTYSSPSATNSSELAVPATNAQTGTWTATGTLTTNCFYDTLTLLTNGLALVAGGSGTSGYLANAALYNPSNGTWTATGQLNAARFQHTATLLTNGQVLVAGGIGTNSLSLTNAELYNPATGMWTPTGSLNAARSQHTATLLTNGLVLVAGGYGTTAILANAELYNPSNETWTNTGSLNTARENHTATLLTNGLVLVAGGNNGSTEISSAELYNPSNGTWTNTGSLNTARKYHTATLLPNGQVLVAGGTGTNSLSLTNAELYNPDTQTWTTTGSLNIARQYHTTTLLPNGLVLVAAGEDTNGNILASTELYNPAIGTWTTNASLNTAREFHTATLLTNGEVLVAAGLESAGILTNAELYNVGLGFSASAQPQIISNTSPLILGGSLGITGSRFRGISEGSGGNGSQDSPADYPVVQLLSLESGQMQFLLTSNWSSNSYTSDTVTNFPPGYAMVTAFVNGIPSAGSIISVGLPAGSGGGSQFTYTTNNGTVTITGYSGPGGAVVIPTTNANDLPVTAIGTNVFYDFASLTSVTISSNITNLGNFAFYGCSNLTSIYFQGNAPTYGSNVFVNDTNSTVYYSSGTSGWSNTFDGLPTEAPSMLTLTNLHSFSVFSNGSDPVAGLVQGSDGNFYGTTSSGGTNGGGYGTVFKVTTNGVATVLYEFTGGFDGANPRAGLVQGINGNFYGMTYQGGNYGRGNIFKITTNGLLTNLYSFTGGNDGANPQAALAQGNNGSFYGTTGGGSHGLGNIFTITTNGQFSVLYAFGSVEQTNVTSYTNTVIVGKTNLCEYITDATNYIALDGSNPNGLVLGLDGNLYGTTQGGGANNYGSVFKITTNGTLTNLHSFSSSDGAYPSAALVQATSGSFYGTTRLGGNYGYGTFFQIMTNGTFTSLTSFDYINEDVKNAGGANSQAALVQGSNGDFYGTTAYGGTNGYGMVFQITSNGTLTVLYPFTGGNDGANPQAALVQGSDGNFYGTATGGGVGIGSGGNGTVFKIATNGTFTALYAFPGENDAQSANAMVHGSDGNFYGTAQNGGTNGANGSVFKITTNGTLSGLYSFTNGSDGANPFTALVQGSNGNFYGTANNGGDYGYGTIFQIMPDGTFTILYSFTGGNDGSYPLSTLVEGGDGRFYGVTQSGGVNGAGNVFKITANGQFSTLYSFGSVEQPDGTYSFTNVTPCGTNIYTYPNYIAVDGTAPNGLVMGFDGNFYGTAQDGGEYDNGTVFQITPNGSLTTLYSFTGNNDGMTPYMPLVQGGNGNFYGATSSGGTNGYGTVFEISPSGSLTTLYSFTGDTDGNNPNSLLAGTDGNFYGTTSFGGTNYSGNVFEIMANGTYYDLYDFTGGADGGSPSTGLVQGSDGSLFGTTSSGAVGGYGGVFRLSGSGLPSPLPIITLQPSNPPPTLTGLSAAFTIDALGGAPLSYQWQHNGVPLSASDDFYGLDIGTLTVLAAAPGDAGTYSVVVSNSYGTTTSSNAVLTLFADTNAMEDFEAGTNYVVVGDYVLANFSFSNALASSPANATNANYNFFNAVTELLSLPQEPAGSNFLTRIGIGSAGRDIFNWQATKPTNAEGHLAVPITTPPLNADEFTAQLRTNALPAIIAAEGNLAEITNTNFSIALTTNETHGGAVTVDWGDVQMLQAMGDVTELFIYTTYSWNLNVQLATATNYLSSDGNIEAFLTNYPSLLTTTSTADLPAAQAAFTNAINEYFSASQFIRNPNRPAYATPHLFDLDPAKAQEELQFRETLLDLLISLTSPAAVPLTVNPAISVSAQAFFSGNFDLRSYLPQFQGSEVVWDSFPDPTFGGIVTGVTETKLEGHHLRHSETVLDLPGTSLSVFYNFTNYSDQTAVVQGLDGNFYGTMSTGGPYIDSDQMFGIGYGSVFKITTNGQFSTLYNFGTVQDEFGNPLDGAYPNALILGSDGNFYGTTMVAGTNGGGTFFKITNGLLTTLYSFGTEADADAYAPAAALVQGTNGNLYGTTLYGGTHGAGTIFVISTNGDITNLYSFSGYSDGGEPFGVPLVQATNGTLYGTTSQGGDNYYGTIFKIKTSASHTFTTLYSFGTQMDDYGDPVDGAVPNGLVLGTNGILYGTAQYGGINDDYNIGFNEGVFGTYGNGDGTLFSITPGGTFSNILSFDENSSDGYNPIGSLLPGPNGTFFGIASAGGANNRGAVFIFNPGSAPTNIAWLSKSSGSYGGNLQSFVNFEYNDIEDLYGNLNPVPSFLTLGLDGNLYGTTTDDGTNGSGTVYALNLNATNYTPLLIWDTPADIIYGTPLGPNQLNATVAFDVPGSFAYNPANGTVLNAGTNMLSVIFTPSNTNYTTVSNSVTIMVMTSTATMIDFDPLAGLGSVVGGAPLTDYLATYGVSVTNNSPGTTVVAENQASLAGGGFVMAASPPNVLTQIGSNGPVRFTVGFANFLTQFSFTRPELLANPFVTHPQWQAQAFDSLGNLLGQAQEPQISSSVNVPAQTYTLTGDGIASVEFSSEGNGQTTFNAMLLDNFVLTAGTSNTLLPSVDITSPTNGQLFTNVASIPITVETAAGTGTVTGVAFYYSGAFAGAATTSPFSIMGLVPANGPYVLTAVVTNSSGLISTSAPVSITVATGFGFETLPMSQTVGAGNNATFSVTTTGTNVSYQWQHNGTNIPGANLSSYTVKNATTNAAGSYTVVAVSGSQSIASSPPAVLTVLSPPMIGLISSTTNSPYITLSVMVSDGTNFFTQWLHNGTGIAGTTNSYPAGTATTTTYTFLDAPFNSGNYEVVVGNGVTSSNSLPFTVNLSPTTITTTNNKFASSLAINPLAGPSPWPGVAGSNSSSSSGPAVIAGKPSGGFLWYNWTPNVSGVIYLTTLGSSFDTLLGIYTGSYPGNLTKVAEDDDSAGFFTSLVSFNFQSGTNYQIVVAGYKGATGNVVLELSPGAAAGLPGPPGGYVITNEPEPVITQQPSNQIVNVGANVTLSVQAGNPVTSYQWYFENTNNPVGSNADTYVITNFLVGDAGNYFVQVSNTVGVVQSAIATIEIQSTNETSGTQTNLAVDKFGDAADLTGANAPDHFRPEDGGGDTGGFTLAQAFSTVGATKEEGEPNHAGQPGGASYWYTYSSFSPGTLRFDTTNSAFSTILAVYVNGNPNAAASFASLVSVGSNFTTNFTVQGQPSVTVSNAFPYPKYYIAIDGYQGASGAAYLNVFSAPNTNAVPVTNTPPAVTITSPANNFLSPSATITVKGTVKGIASVSSVQVAVNTNAFEQIPVTVESKNFNWSTSVTLVPGANVITAQSITGEGTNTEIVSDPVTCTIFYDATPPSAAFKAPLTLETNGSGKITGEAGHASLEIGKIYTVKAAPIGNWVFDYWNGGTNTNSLSFMSDSATLAFDMATNLVLQANFVTNPFTAVAGVYNGLFSPPSGVTEASSGFLTVTLPASSHGAYSAKLLLDGGTYSFSGAFDLNGDAEETVARSGKTSLTVNLQLDLPATNDLMGGSVSEIATNGWTSEIVADRITFNAKSNPATNYAGKYTLIIPPGGATNAPGGYGYATLANTLAGLVTVSGSLADKTAISQSVAVSEDGNIPLYVSLYSHKGSLLGWLTLTNQSAGHPAQTIVGADLAWIKTNLPKTLYPEGFTNTNLTAIGSYYTNGIDFTNCTLTISNGDLGGALTNTNVALVDNKLVSTGSGTLSGTIKSSTGIVTVTFRPKNASSSTVATGVVIQDTNSTTTNAAGWFLGPTQSGYFLLQQNP